MIASRARCFFVSFVSLLLSLWICVSLAGLATAQEASTAGPGDASLAEYFRAETKKLADRCLTDVQTAEDWHARKDELRSQLLEMLGLHPLPDRTPLQTTVTGEVEHDDFVVKKLHFQSRPNLYVTGNLYIPKASAEPLPAVLYVCGHGRVIEDGVSYGNKVYYQHHPAWFARNGYVCLTIDTLQLGEIQGTHHGTYREDMWWWINRGYTPAGVEAWNCMRAVDLLQSLPEVDGERIGITGRSGGGAYSWWAAAIDERIRCAVPVAGITDLQNHVVDGCVEGHCDCMFMVNTHRWDYPLLAALVAPRPLLISNTDSDQIFPLDGVYRTFEKVRRIYALLDAEDQVALNITAGPHKDTQELRVHAFRWMNRHLKGDADSLVQPAEKFFDRQELRVFQVLPDDQQNTTIHESFVAASQPPLPSSKTQWHEQRERWEKTLRQRVFSGWPQKLAIPTLQKTFDVTVDGLRLQRIDFEGQPHAPLSLLLAQSDRVNQDSSLKLHVLDGEGWDELQQQLAPAFGHRLAVSNTGDEAAFVAWARTIRSSKEAHAYLAVRGVGPSTWDHSERKQIQNRRRFYLLGQTRDAMRVLDVVQTMRALEARYPSVTLHGSGDMAGIAMYAALMHEGSSVKKLELTDLPASHRKGPILPGVRKYFDLPQTMGWAASRFDVTVETPEPGSFQYAKSLMELLGRSERLKIRNAP